MSALRVYHLRPRREYIAKFDLYDAFTGFILIAETEEDARLLVGRCGAECRSRECSEAERGIEGATRAHCVWMRPKATECVLIGTAAECETPRLVLSRYNAG